MHKKLESDLISLAHSLLQMKNKENVFLLKQKAHEIYEKLSVLAFVEEYVNTTPGVNVKKEALILKVEEAYKVKDQSSKEADEANKVEVIAEDFKEVLLDVENEKTFRNESQNNIAIFMSWCTVLLWLGKLVHMCF